MRYVLLAMLLLFSGGAFAETIRYETKVNGKRIVDSVITYTDEYGSYRGTIRGKPLIVRHTKNPDDSWRVAGEYSNGKMRLVWDIGKEVGPYYHNLSQKRLTLFSEEATHPGHTVLLYVGVSDGIREYQETTSIVMGEGVEFKSVCTIRVNERNRKESSSCISGSDFLEMKRIPERVR